MSAIQAPAETVEVVDESELVSRLRAGDKKAILLAIQMYGSHVLNLAKRMMGNVHDAEDCFQEVFIQAYRSFENYSEESPLWYWIRGITVNVSLMKLRQARRRSEVMICYVLIP